jgi:hypothetical protein
MPRTLAHVHEEKKNVTVFDLKMAMLANPTSTLFNLPLSFEAFNQFEQLNLIFTSSPRTEEHDNWFYIWGSSIFTSKKAYRHLIGNIEADQMFRWIWKSSCQLKHKVFLWLQIKH